MNTERAKNASDEFADLVGFDDPRNRILMGPHTAFQYRHDPKHLCFVLSRYKFCAKLLAGKGAVLEVGCGDAFPAPIVAQVVQRLTAIDWDARMIDSIAERLSFLENFSFHRHDIIEGPVADTFDAVYSVDVIEHIDPTREHLFMQNCCRSLSRDGVMLMGTPNIKSDAYASPASRAGHINLKDHGSLRALLAGYFKNVFLFSMNDEVVHTGFYPMAHYLWGIGVGLK